MFRRKREKLLMAELQHLQQEVKELQHFYDCDITSAETTNTTTYKSNAYPSYSSRTVELGKKYQGSARWGNDITRNLIDTRAAFIIGNGIIVKDKRGQSDSKELLFIKDFLEFNDLDEEGPQDWAIEAEIEGKFLSRIAPDEEAVSDNAKLGNIIARFISWTATQYEVQTDPADYKDYTSVKWKPSGSGTEETMEANEFVYKRFGGRANKVNITPSKVSAVLKSIEDLDKAKWDWRTINHFHASPTPTIETEDKQSAEDIRAQLAKTNWKIGKLLVLWKAKLNIVGMPTELYKGVLEEILTHVKSISGGTGIPPHFLGFADLLKNRSTSENLMEEVTAATAKDRKVWKGFYEELCLKAMEMANENFQYGFDTGVIEVEIPYITKEQFDRLVDIWLPLQMGSAISMKTLRAKVPDIDPEAEKKAIEEEDADAFTPTPDPTDDDGGDE